MEQSRQSIPKPIIVLIIFLVAVFLAALTYFFFIRVQDSDYDKAIAQIDRMTTSANEISELGKTTDLDPGTVQQASLNKTKQEASAYLDAIRQLKQSVVLARDNEVQKVYADTKGTIEEYGETSFSMFTTLEAYSHIKQDCNKLLANVSSIATLAQLDEESAACQDAVDKNTAVPQSDFNENYFQKYHGYVVDLLDSLRAYYTAGHADSNSQMRAAQTSITKALTSIGDLNESGDYPITNSKNPKDALAKMKSVLQKQKSITMR